MSPCAILKWVSNCQQLPGVPQQSLLGGLHGHSQSLPPQWLTEQLGAIVVWYARARGAEDLRNSGFPHDLGP